METAGDLAAAVEAAIGPLLDVLDSARDDPRLPVSATQFRVLTILSRRPGLNLGGLADALDVVPSSASRLCDRLAATGLLSRAPDPRDRREVQLTLTPTAQGILDELRLRRCRAIESVLLRMPPTARQDLLSSLAAFAAAVATGPDPSAPVTAGDTVEAGADETMTERADRGTGRRHRKPGRIEGAA